MTTGWNHFFPAGTRVLALPSGRHPRLYLPDRGIAQRWEASSFYPASRRGARLYKLLLRLGISARLVGAGAEASGEWPLGEFANGVLPGVASAVVLVGTAGPAQKVTARLRDEKGQVLGYLKYAETETARRRLRQEHRMLCAIPEGLGPKALKHGVLGEGEALLTTPVSGRRLPSNLPLATGVAEFSQACVRAAGVPVRDHPWVRAVREERPEGSRLDGSFEVLATRLWPVVAQHGDFAPWNLIRRPGGEVEAFDWEYGTMDGFPHLDLAYYVLQVAALIKRWTPTRAFRYAVQHLSGEHRLGLSGEEAGALTRLAAYDAYRKASEDGHGPEDGLQPWRREIWEGESCGA